MKKLRPTREPYHQPKRAAETVTWRRALTSRPCPNARQTPLVSGKAPQIRVAVSETPMITNGDRLPDVIQSTTRHVRPTGTVTRPRRLQEPNENCGGKYATGSTIDSWSRLDGSGFDHCLFEIAANMSGLADVFCAILVWCSLLTSASRLLVFASCWLYPNLSLESDLSRFPYFSEDVR